jgi:hypothetical protein
MTNSLAIYAGRKAKAHITQNGLQAKDIRVVAGAAGGPKGLILLGLDKFIFGEWLPTSNQPVNLLGASIGAWRMATACMADSNAGFDRLAADYIAQDYEPTYNKSGQRVMPSSTLISTEFGKALSSFYDGQLDTVLNHPRYRLHILTSRGRGFLKQLDTANRLEPRVVLGFAAAFFANLANRRAMSALMERVVFSTGTSGALHDMPFQANDYATQQMPLLQANFHAALQASCSIPFILNAINDIPHAPTGSYWDGGMTDYHCHMDFAGKLRDDEIVLVPHFQKHLVAGWLDKGLKWRHKNTAFLDNVVVLAPTPSFVASLPNAKIPDRDDFKTYMDDFAGRERAWRESVSASQQLVQEFKAFLQSQDTARIQEL